MTPRQRRILSSIIKEFMDTAAEVGSTSLVSKYELEVSSATVRNEMVQLTEMGFLHKPHTSAGRIPTTTGMRFYLQEVLEEETPSPLDEVEIQENLFQKRFDGERLIREALEALVRRTKCVALAAVNNSILYSGVSMILGLPEFDDVEDLRRVINVIEDYSLVSDVFSRSQSERDVKVLVGHECGLEALNDCAVVFTEFEYYRGSNGIVGVMGPVRMNYDTVIPNVRLVGQTLSSVAKGW